jgi:sulfonate transport system ATP-binding protein
MNTTILQGDLDAIADLLAPNSALQPAAASVALRGVTKSFGRNGVLHGVDLAIPAGQFVAIVGRSGSGKSTLLRLVAGLESPDDGHVAVGGEEAARHRMVRLMFQEPRLLPWARVVANVAVGLSGEESPLTRHKLAMEALHRVGLAGRAEEWPAVLSGGQKQRVALARALISRPRLLALDEPLGALDALTRIEMQRLIEAAWRLQRFTAILVTHDVTEAVTMADRILLLEAGRIAEDIAIDQPRPRRIGNPDLGVIEERIFARLLEA